MKRAFAAKNIIRNNPARWDKLLRQRLPEETKKGASFPALPFYLTNTFLAELRKRTDTAAPAVEFVFYTAARSGEVCGATWREIDLDRKLWTIPATRMKKGEEETEYPEPILEMALAHKIDDAVKAAYQRGDLLKKRRALLD